MALIIKPRIKETTSTVGTGALTLGGAATGYQSFASCMTSPSDTCYYGIQGYNGDGSLYGDFECGLGTYSATNTLTRTTVVASSNSNALISLQAGKTYHVWIDFSASQIAGYASLVMAQQWNAGQGCIPSQFTDASTITLNLALSNVFWGVLGGSRTLGVPTNAMEGQSGVILPRQDTTGSRTLALAWCWKVAGAGTLTLSTAAGTEDQLPFSVDVARSSTVTITLNTPGIVTWTSHGMVTGQQVQLTTTGALPTGLSQNTTYYLVYVNSSTFSLATSLANAVAGTSITTSGSQSGVHTMAAYSIKIALNKAFS